MDLLMVGAGVLLVLLLLAGVLATGSVVARLAAHMRDDAWARLTDRFVDLRRQESELLDAVRHGKCAACGGRHPAAGDDHGNERGN